MSLLRAPVEDGVISPSTSADGPADYLSLPTYPLPPPRPPKSRSYALDAYTTYAASILASVGFCRSLAGFGLPLAAPSLYANLGYDYGNLLLACIALVLGVPAPILLWKYGAYLRARSPYASEASLRKS